MPFGVALGAAWRSVAAGIGIVVTPEVSLTATLGVVGRALIVAVALAPSFAARAFSRPAAEWLRAE